MSMTSAAASHVPGHGMEPETTTYQRVPYNFPAVGVWLPTTENAHASGKEEGKKEMQRAADRKAKASFFERVAVKVTSASRKRRTKVSPQSSSTTESSTTKNSADVQLTALEKQYLDYLRRSVGTGQFSHYLMPA